MQGSAIIPHLVHLALTADEKLSPQQKRELMWLILFVVAAGITLIVVVMLLMRSNRRQLRKLESEKPKGPAVIPDIWKAGGDRLVARMSPFPKANPSDAHLDPDDEDQASRDDENSTGGDTDDPTDEEENDDKNPRR